VQLDWARHFAAGSSMLHSAGCKLCTLKMPQAPASSPAGEHSADGLRFKRVSAILQRMGSHTLAASVLILCSGIALAADAVPFLPAAFTDEPRSLQKRIVFPKVEGEISLIVVCDAFVSTTGLMGWNRCFAKDNRYIKYETAIERGAKWAWLRPAMVAGRPREVRVSYSVLFAREAGKESIRVVPHHFLNVKEYGENYSGPQRYGETGSWRGCAHGIKVWMAIDVDEKGVVASAVPLGTIDQTDERSVRCVAMVRDLAASGKYIPAMVDGQAVTSLTYELYMSYDRARPYKSSPGMK